MIRIITLLIILACIGCQTTSTQPHKTIIPTKEQISVLIKHDRFDSGYGITVKWSELKSDGTEDVFSAPMSSGKLDEWLHCDVNETPLNLESKISYLIEDEKIEVTALPGVNLISKISPVTEQTVHVTGVFSASKFNKSGKLIHMSVPINAICTLDESKIIYEKEIKLKPVN